MSTKTEQSSHPDADLHPVATGQAKHTVDAHKDPKPLKLYAGWFCPFVQRTWTVLEEKGIPYEYVEVNPYHKPESLLKLNPRGLVPTMSVQKADGVKPLYDSTILCEYLEESYPGFGPSLLPEDLYERARMRIWQDFVGSRFIPGFHRFLQHQPSSAGGSDEGLDKARQEFLGLIKQFTQEMDPEGPFFMGPTPQMVDFIFAPWAIRLWIFDHYKGGLGVPAEGQGGEDEKIWTRWRKYAKAIGDRKSIKDTTSDREHYLPIYQRYADDQVRGALSASSSELNISQAQSELAKATRAGRGVP